MSGTPRPRKGPTIWLPVGVILGAALLRAAEALRQLTDD